MPKTEEKLIEEMCWLLETPELPYTVTASSTECKILASSLSSAKSNLPKGSHRRVFLQDFAASLNRKKILPTNKVEQFTQIGYEYMET